MTTNTTTTQGDTTMNNTDQQYAYARSHATMKYLAQFDLPEEIVMHCGEAVRLFHTKRADLASTLRGIIRDSERELATLEQGYQSNSLGIYHSATANANRLAAEISQCRDNVASALYLVRAFIKSAEGFDKEVLRNHVFGEMA